MKRRVFACWLFASGLAACAPTDRLSFPDTPTHVAGRETWYDTDRDGKPDFALTHADDGRMITLGYDDDADGGADRRYHLQDFDPEALPHLVVLIDSVSYPALRASLAERAPGPWGAFYEPAKVIAPYPSMSALCFGAILHAPPMPGAINRHYDPRPQHRGVTNLITKRLGGYRNPWHRRLHYHIDYDENGRAWLNPRPYLRAEFERARQAFDASPHRTTIVYVSSSAAMIMKHGQEGLDETIDELEKFLLQVLYERRGAVRISVASDHGHNLRDTEWIDVERTLRDAGFRVTDRPRRPDDVFVEMDGLMTWFGVHTPRPAVVADTLLAGHDEIETVAYLHGDSVVVQGHRGAARITMDDKRLVYTPETADVLDYGDRLSDVAMSRDEWFDATADHTFPDAPARLWDAFHLGTVNVPQVMVTVKDGYCAGIGWFRWFVDPRSTHGGLNQVNSAAFVMTTGRPIDGPLRSAEVFDAIQPGYVPPVVRGAGE
ncbi:MAG: hypothetical protein AAF800_03985 [Planctomycetota bacterium]